MKDIDISKHRLVPQHVILKEEEKQGLLERFNVSVGQLPRILVSDPMVKKLDAKIGDVIMITRKSPTAGTTDYYRVVVKGEFK